MSCRQYDKYPFVGIYKIFTPCLLIRDPELIKLILINEFSNFYNNTITFDEADPITGKNPFVLNGEKWKTFRAQLTPLFTTAKVFLITLKDFVNIILYRLNQQYQYLMIVRKKW